MDLLTGYSFKKRLVCLVMLCGVGGVVLSILVAAACANFAAGSESATRRRDSTEPDWRYWITKDPSGIVPHEAMVAERFEWLQKQADQQWLARMADGRHDPEIQECYRLSGIGAEGARLFIRFEGMTDLSSGEVLLTDAGWPMHCLSLRRWSVHSAWVPTVQPYPDGAILLGGLVVNSLVFGMVLAASAGVWTLNMRARRGLALKAGGPAA